MAKEVNAKAIEIDEFIKNVPSKILLVNVLILLAIISRPVIIFILNKGNYNSDSGDVLCILSTSFFLDAIIRIIKIIGSLKGERHILANDNDISYTKKEVNEAYQRYMDIKNTIKHSLKDALIHHFVYRLLKK